MEERESIALNIQLPAGTLEGLTRLVEQLRYLAAEVNGGGRHAAPATPAEAGENPAFNWARYQGLERGAAAVPFEQAASPETARAALTAGSASSQSAGWEVSDSPSQAAAADGRTAPPVEEGGVPLPSVGEDQTDLSVPPAAESAEMQDLRDTAASRVPEVVSTPAPVDAAPEAEFSFPAAASGSGRKEAVAEELVWEGSAPLTAQAVSQAFRRDGRRYDNAFPLY